MTKCNNPTCAREIGDRQMDVEHFRAQLANANEELKWRRGVHAVTGEVDRLRVENARLREALAKDARDCPVHNPANPKEQVCKKQKSK